ncbi:MAG: hypothetical protein ICV74_09950 [Thermoleophilia bacterium]|nr:hypothetical protein [Thermoleophilia bacterium]
MITRLVVAAVFVLAAAAAGDAFRPAGGTDAPARPAAGSPSGSVAGVPRSGRERTPRYVGEGSFLRKSVVRGRREYLSAEAVEDAFPGSATGPIDISKIAVAPDGTLVLAVYRFPAGQPAVGAVQFWRHRRLVGAFVVPPGFFGGGMAFDRTGALVALFSRDGALRGVYDRAGRRLQGLPASFLLVD